MNGNTFLAAERFKCLGSLVHRMAFGVREGYHEWIDLEMRQSEQKWE
jgi:hypothetical protein